MPPFFNMVMFPEAWNSLTIKNSMKKRKMAVSVSAVKQMECAVFG